MGETAIRLHDVSKAFGDNQVLRGARFEVERGQNVALLGGSGSGKSVTLKTINGLIPPDEGVVEVLGETVSSMSETELAPLRKRVSYLFQRGALFDSMNVFDNVSFPLREHRELNDEALAARTRELLDLVQLGDVEEMMPAHLSGGMRKRVALARALALEPEVVLYDEPTSGLDPVTGETIAELICDLHRSLGATSVVVTHDIRLVDRVADRVVFLDGGRFVFAGAPAEVDQQAPEKVRRFFSAGGFHG